MREIEFIIDGLTALRPQFLAAWRAAASALKSGIAVDLIVRERKTKRSNDQNRKLNAMCRDLADQVEWHGQRLTLDDWRHIFVAAYRGEQRIVPGIGGGFVVLGASSRRLTVAECSDVIELISAFGAERMIVWSDPSNRRESAA